MCQETASVRRDCPHTEEMEMDSKNVTYEDVKCRLSLISIDSLEKYQSLWDDNQWIHYIFDDGYLGKVIVGQIFEATNRALLISQDRECGHSTSNSDKYITISIPNPRCFEYNREISSGFHGFPPYVILDNDSLDGITFMQQFDQYELSPVQPFELDHISTSETFALLDGKPKKVKEVKRTSCNRALLVFESPLEFEYYIWFNIPSNEWLKVGQCNRWSLSLTEITQGVNESTDFSHDICRLTSCFAWDEFMVQLEQIEPCDIFEEWKGREQCSWIGYLSPDFKTCKYRLHLRHHSDHLTSSPCWSPLRFNCCKALQKKRWKTETRLGKHQVSVKRSNI